MDYLVVSKKRKGEKELVKNCENTTTEHKESYVTTVEKTYIGVE